MEDEVIVWVCEHYVHGPLNYVLSEEQPEGVDRHWYHYCCPCGETSPVVEEG